MKSNIFSKTNMGGALLLLGILILSQSRLFHLFTETVLGRFVLVALLILLSYLNKILGVVFVLILIISMNYKYDPYDFSYMEGFTSDGSGNAMDLSGNKMDVSGNKMDVSGNMTRPNGKNIQAVMQAKQQQSVSKNQDASGNSSETSVEGFDVLGIERNLQEGKNSNSMHVQHGSRKYEKVDPFHHSYFGNSFSPF